MTLPLKHKCAWGTCKNPGNYLIKYRGVDWTVCSVHRKVAAKQGVV